MSIKIFTASHQAKLAHQLAEDLKGDQRSVFQPTYIISANQLQDSWLKEELANNMGIVAHLKFLRPEAFIKWIAQRLTGSREERWSSEQMDWLAFSIMGSKDFKARFPRIAQYFQEDSIKRFALAQKAVRLLDKYQEFRPEMVRDWQTDTIIGEEDWQKYLYLKLSEKLGTSMGDKISLHTDITKGLEDQEKLKWLKDELHTLYLFGPLSLTPYYLDLFGLLEKHVPMLVYQNRIDTDNTSHPLEENWGKRLLEQVQATKNHWPNADWVVLEEDYEEKTSLLHAIQTDDTGSSLTDDSSMEFHSCHTRVREVEALYNYLVKTVDRQTGIGSRDIMVMVPQLDLYVAAIKTVFDTAPYKFPYQFVAKGFGQEESFWTAFEAILSLEGDSFNATTVFSLIERRPVQESFGFEDLDLLRKVISDAKIRRELDGDTETETRYHSWNYGLKKLIYGYCLGEDELLYHDGDEDFYTVDRAEGQQAKELLRLYHFVQLLGELVAEKNKAKTLQDWLQWADEVAQTFLTPNAGEYKAFQHLLQQNGLVGEMLEEEISFQLFFYRFRDQLAEMDTQQLQGFGGITFSELLPGRSLPKKVTAFMGMNFGDFPRKSKPLEFDLMKKSERRVLDPDPRSRDQATFWQSFSQASDAVFISWLGQSDKDNKELPASTLVEELMDFTAEKLSVEKESLLIKHSLHGHSVRYNDGDGKLVNYLNGNLKGKIFSPATQKQIPSDPLETVHFSQLVKFLADPFEYYFTKVLKVYYSDNSAVLENTELFGLDNLQEWAIKSHIILEEEYEFPEVNKELGLKGNLPLRNKGTENLLCLESEVEEMRSSYLMAKGSEPIEEMDFKLDLDRILPPLIGSISHFQDEVFFYLTPSDDKCKYKVQVYVRLLVLAALGKKAEVVFFHKKAPQGKIILISMNAEDAKEELRFLLSLFENAQKYLVPLFLDLNKDADLVEEMRPIQIIDLLGKIPSYFKYLHRALGQGMCYEEGFLEDFKKNYCRITIQWNEIFKK